MALKGMSLYEYCMTNPEAMHLLSQFDQSRNSKSPHEIYYLASTKVWWYCAEHDYSWEAYVKNRVNYPTAPCCSGKVATSTNNFAVLYPNLLTEWNWEENNKLGLDPYKLLPKAHVKVNWKCTHGHKWQTRLDSRTENGSGCPVCKKCHK